MNSQKRRAVATFFAAGTIDKQQIPMALRRLGLMPDKRVWLRLFDQILLASGIVAMALSMIFFIFIMEKKIVGKHSKKKF